MWTPNTGLDTVGYVASSQPSLYPSVFPEQVMK